MDEMENVQMADRLDKQIEVGVANKHIGIGVVGGIGAVRNIVLIALVACVLLGAGLNAALSETGLIQRPVRSSLEGKEYQMYAEATPSALVEGRFQDQVEKLLADAVPNRDSAMLCNAFVQRRTIELANIPFGFAGYPSFYGSEYLVWPAKGAVAEVPQKRTPQVEESYGRAADLSSQLAQAFPGINWYFCLADRGGSTKALPFQALMSSTLDYDGYREIFLDKLSKAFTIIDGNAYSNADEYLSDYYLTDHHWNIDGALKCYNRIVAAMGDAQVTWGSAISDLGEVRRVYPNTFWGSQARLGLCPEGPGDVVRDVFYDLSGLEIRINGEQKDPSALNVGATDSAAQYPVSGRFDQVRANWLHYDYGVMDIVNPQVEEGSLLIIRDSFSSDIERFFTANYHRVCVVDLRYLDGTLGDILSQGDFDDALYLEAFWTPVNETHQWNLEQAISSSREAISSSGR